VQDILDFIEALRSLYPERYKEFSGGCLKFATLLVSVFGKRKKWHLATDGNHVITAFDNGVRLFWVDIDGEVTVLNDFLKVENNLDLIWQFRDVLSREDFKFCLKTLCVGGK